VVEPAEQDRCWILGRATHEIGGTTASTAEKRWTGGDIAHGGRHGRWPCGATEC
jgi:hypothetical protein